MSKTGKTQGAAAFTHALKEYGGGKSMAAGIKRIASEEKRKGFEEGIAYAFKRTTLLERLLGRTLNH